MLSADTLQNQGLIVELWKVLGKQIDSLAAAYNGDNRFDSLEPYRLMPLPQKSADNVLYDSHPVESFQLYGNYPNPFNSTTTIRVKVPHASNGTLSIYDIRGALIGVVFNGFLSPGTHSVRIDLGQVSSGVYFYRFKSRDFGETKRMVLLR